MICPNCQQEATAVNHNNRGWRTTCCWERVPEPEPQTLDPVVINTGDGVDDQEARAAGQALAARRKQSKNKKSVVSSQAILSDI